MHAHRENEIKAGTIQIADAYHGFTFAGVDLGKFGEDYDRELTPDEQTELDTVFAAADKFLQSLGVTL